MKPLRLDGYPRVSKVGGRDGEGFISVPVQTDGMTKWAEHRGHTITIHEPELDRSGGTMDRPVFNRIMDRIANGESDGIIVYKVDRFARSLLGALTTLAAIEKAGGTFASVSDNIDLTTAQGRAFLHMQLVFAELFREQIREGFDVATGRAVARGVHVANSVPPGYLKDPETALLTADPYAAPVIRELFERRADGQGASHLARWLDEALPRPNGEHWTPAHVRRMLGFRVYLGEASYGRHRNRTAHEPIVSEALFQRAAIARGVSQPRGDRANLLAGLVRCAHCRYSMTPSKAGANGDQLTYRCREKHTAGRCPSPTVIGRERLEEYVEQQALALAVEAGDVPEYQDGTALEEATSLLAELTAERDAFAKDTRARKILGDDAYYAALEARAEAVREQERTVGSLVHTGPSGALEGYEDWSIEDKRSVLTNMIDAVFIRKASGSRAPVESRAWIAWRGEGPDDLPRRGRVNGPVRPVAWPEHAAGVAAH